MYLFYATRDGQARRIVERIAERLAERGITATPYDLATDLPAMTALSRLPVIVVVAAVRYGRHLPEADQFLSSFQTRLASVPLALASVNLTARKPGKDTLAGNAYLRKLITRHRLAPVLALPIAGRLDYQRYTWWDRQVIRLIMKLTDGPTDPTASVEYTSWEAVDAFALRIVEIHRAAVAP